MTRAPLCPRCKTRPASIGWTCPKSYRIAMCAPCYAEDLFRGWQYDPARKKYVPIEKAEVKEAPHDPQPHPRRGRPRRNRR